MAAARDLERFAILPTVATLASISNNVQAVTTTNQPSTTLAYIRRRKKLVITFTSPPMTQHIKDIYKLPRDRKRIGIVTCLQWPVVAICPCEASTAYDLFSRSMFSHPTLSFDKTLFIVSVILRSVYDLYLFYFAHYLLEDVDLKVTNVLVLWCCVSFKNVLVVRIPCGCHWRWQQTGMKRNTFSFYLLLCRFK